MGDAPRTAVAHPHRGHCILGVIDQVRQGHQPGSFAVIGIPVFGSLALIGAFAFFVLIRAVLGSRGTSARTLSRNGELRGR